MSLGAQLSIQLLEHRCLPWARNVFSIVFNCFRNSFTYAIDYFSSGGKSFAHRTSLDFGQHMLHLFVKRVAKTSRGVISTFALL